MFSVLKKEQVNLHTVQKNKDIKTTLLNKFLFEDDSTCLQILLNLYNIEDSIENVLPSYISMKNLKSDIIRYLNPNQGRELVAQNVTNLIHGDITRLELCVYLEGYRMGYKSKKWSNQLEILTFNHVSVEDIYKSAFIPKDLDQCKEIYLFRQKLDNIIEKDDKIQKFLFDLVHIYCKKVLRPKIFHINKYLDRQLMIDYDSDEISFVEAHLPLRFRDISCMYKRLLNFLVRDCMRVYQKAYWDGMNNQVMKRYH
ncbi:MAG: hypothetical protein KHZ78_00855 [Peptoniphilus sp. oral taxon 375]|nr:hypothetical protein [Peptoniphilus sp. oral taxon 375]